ncbi:MAG TPA: hypothetical protein VJ438_05310 [Candidatus Nanoarchaeia archaeon]|nr:hypothetical protein [Candidatus Nanoarchaeia archaeon]
MRKYEKDLLIGTILTFVGVIFLLGFRFSLILSWTVIIIGKLIVIFSIMEYIDRRRAFRGEDLSSDNKFRKIIRKARKKRYS